MDKYIHIQDDSKATYSGIAKSKTALNEEWVEIKHKKAKQGINTIKKKTIVGKNSNAADSLKGVPKQIDLHVYRLAPNTDVTTLTEFLKVSFPEVSCQVLTPRYPDLYSSFKIRIFEKNLDKAMDPLLWPEDACIRPFLYRRPNTKINQ